MRFEFTAPTAQFTIKNNAGDVIYHTRADNYVFEADASGIASALQQFVLLLKTLETGIHTANQARFADPFADLDAHPGDPFADFAPRTATGGADLPSSAS